MDSFNKINMMLDENQTKKLLQQLQTNPQFTVQLQEALLTKDHMKIDELFESEGIKRF